MRGLRHPDDPRRYALPDDDIKAYVRQAAGWWWAIRPGTTYRHPLGRPHHDWKAAMDHALREDHL